MAKSPSSISSDILELYDALIASVPGVERKGASMAYTSLNGHMISFLTPAGVLALRLPDNAREAFLAKYKTKLCEQHGVILKEYIEVPSPLLKKTRELAEYFQISGEFAASLKPKPTKKKPKK